MTAYLYDQPTSGQGLRFANAWRNSGAAALASKFVQRYAGVGSDAVPGPGPGVALTGAQLADLLDEFLGSQDWRTGGR